MIKQLCVSDLEHCLLVIRESHASVAKEFNLTRENCPKHTSFIEMRNLQYHMENGYLMYGYFIKNSIAGYCSLENKDNGVFELHNLAVLPKYRHKGLGTQMLDFCKAKVREMGGSKITLGLIEENITLKKWYCANGFTHVGTKKFEHLPFTVGYMENGLQ